jgi:cellulose biosynthesis protein BcsQ
MSSIVTFYSYKGGVGRSMALANIAVLLARRGLKVLAVDWDLEAPGLERYFSYFEIRLGGPELLRMCMEARQKGTADFRNFICPIDCGAKHPIALLASGREQDGTYSQNLEAFDWEDFFRNNGGQFVEDLRQQWRDRYDVVLIDSRTGLNDTGGICTIQLPDIVVAMFTANYQSLYGVRDVMRLAQKARQSLAYDRMPLSILPLPARWGVQEFQETQVWLDRVTEAVKEFCDDWLPRPIRVRDLIERIKVPQSAFFGFGEKLAVVEQGVTDPQGMGFVYDKIAAFLASDFKDPSTILGELDLGGANTPEQAHPVDRSSLPAGYIYDIFVSYERSLSEGILEFVETLRQEMSALRNGGPQIFVDLTEIRTGQSWHEQIAGALARSKALVAFLTPRYLASQGLLREFMTFRERAHQSGQVVLAPLVLRGSNFPAFVSEFEWFDLRELPIQRISSSHRPPGLQRQIMRLAELLSHMIDQAPPFDPAWNVLSESEISDLGVAAGTPMLPGSSTLAAGTAPSAGGAVWALALTVAFTLNTLDGLRKVSFGLKKYVKGSDINWSLSFELQERKSAADAAFAIVVILDVNVDFALHRAAEEAATDGLTASQVAHALGPAADEAKGTLTGEIDPDDARATILGTLRRL